MKKRMAELTAEQTGKSVEQIIIDGDRDNWFTAKQALDYGFVDHLREFASEVIGGGGTDDSVTKK
jgi:ATP-dependent Clp protease protease subunit